MTSGVIVAGGGLAGCLAALALAERRPDVPLLLVEQAESFGGNHVWSFFDTDVASADRWLVDPLVTCRWPDHEVHFPRRSRTIAIGYNSIRSERLDRHVRARLRPDQYRLGRAIVDLGPNHIRLDGGERIEAGAVIDARGAADLSGLDLAWQKFVGRTYRCAAPHKRARPVIMDARVEQEDGYRFLYTLPFGPDELMAEDTYYSTSPALDVPQLRQRLDDFVAGQGMSGAEAVAEESGVLPVALGGDVMRLWRDDEPPIAKLGLRGGFFHPTTGYTLPDAVRTALTLAGRRDLSAPALHGLFRRRAADLWDERAFYRLLNRMLFRAAAPRSRYRVLEHFYRLPEPVIARFYAAETGAFDKLRILSGRPPVPVGRAIAAMREKAA
ncbi:MAG: lycopene beta-cyclase CrtY [Allosphingosinicella sp.]|uniref:lycopene beta-cyclase CrtY n=1 Tax=Allosphingosinicella sp. TaxID=2823234 RepID=UPI00392B4137